MKSTIVENNGNGQSAPQLKGADLWTSAELRELCRLYHGKKGAFAYHAFDWLNAHVFDERLPIPLQQWAADGLRQMPGINKSKRRRAACYYFASGDMATLTVVRFDGLGGCDHARSPLCARRDYS